eukprot:3167274-Rhodomonas_salina.1
MGREDSESDGSLSPEPFDGGVWPAPLPCPVLTSHMVASCLPACYAMQDSDTPRSARRRAPLRLSSRAVLACRKLSFP